MLQAHMKFNLKSVDKIERELRDRLDRIHERARDEVLPKHSKQILEQSGREVPKDTLALYHSRYALEPVYDEERSEVTQRIGYGGPNDQVNPVTGLMASEYAADQHENFAYKHDPGQKAKYLEDPVRVQGPAFRAALVEMISDELGKGR